MDSEKAVGILKEYKVKVEKELESYLDEKVKEAGRISDFARELVENIKEYNMRGGKRLRPVLAVFGYKCLGGENEKEILKAAVSIEIMQAFLLIHDDIMDDSDLRRGKPAVHKIYEKIAKERFPDVKAGKFGENIAIIAGELLEIWGIEPIMNAGFPAENRLKAVDKYKEVAAGTAFGQVMDTLNGGRDDVEEEDVMLVHKLKTAGYTVEGPLHIGAILAGAKPADLKVLSEYAVPLGQAFQLQDDILGMFADEEDLGKPADSDLKEGKRTLLIVKALENGSREQKEKILAALGNAEAGRGQVEEVRRIIADTGSLDYSKKLAENLVAKAKKAIEKSRFEKEGKDFLLGIADYMVERKL